MKTIDFTLGDAAAVARDTCAKYDIFGSVFTCRTLLAALNKFGKENIRPLSVKVLIFNPYVTKEFKPGQNPSKKRLNALLDHKKGHSVALGMDEAEGDGWKGHLVLIANTPEGTWLIDPTLSIASRPEHNMWLLPIGVKVDDDFGKFDGSRAILKLNDCAVMYSAFPSDLSYEAVLDWSWELMKVDIEITSNQIFERLVHGA